MATLAAGIFGRLVRARDRAYASGWLGVGRLPAPVVSIGNLSVGGSGKTPAVVALGRALMARGLRVDVLSRGYRRQGGKLALAEPSAGLDRLAEVGDEPLLIARSLGAPVLVHPDRFRAGCEGERRFGSQLHLLDDGFQHRQLARDFDLVLVPEADLNDRLLPAGRLREPPTALGRASAILLVSDQPTPGEDPAALAAARRQLKRFSAAPVWVARRQALPGSWQRPGERLYAFCGLARPESFWRTLEAAGIAPVGRREFRDHHRYLASDLRRLAATARAAGATAFVTTAKDAVKLDAAAGIGGLPLLVVEIELAIDDLHRLVESVLSACRARTLS